MPFMSAVTHGTATASVLAKTNSFVAGIPLGRTLLSPFSSSPGTLCPFARLSNFQVKVNGSPFYVSASNYGYEQFYNEFRKGNSAYGGQVPQISSGLLTQTAWETLYPYVVVDLTPKTTDFARDSVAKPVEISFTIASAASLDLYCFIEYENEIKISKMGDLII